jgi:hypothetical protein
VASSTARGGEGLDAAAFVVEHVNAHAAIVRGEAELAPRDQVDGDMILKHLDVGMQGQRGQQRPFDFAPGHVLGVEDAPLGMAAFLAEIEFVQRR